MNRIIRCNFINEYEYCISEIGFAIIEIKEFLHINFDRGVRARARSRCLRLYQIGQLSFRPFSGDRRRSA